MSNIFRRVFDKAKNKKAKGRSEAGESSGAEESSDTPSHDGIGPLDFPDDCDGPSSGVDLVFVHGLRGSRLRTWSRGDIFWPRDLLSKDLKNIRVITWGYDASIAKAFSYASKESLFGHAGTLLNDLARLRRGITRPIIFICHSLGGLVVKEALITSDGYKTHRRHPALGEIYGSTIGVIFMGTPHRGSVKESYGEIAANIAKLSLRQPNKQLLQTLKPDSHIIEKQRDDFTTVSSDMSIVCIREELPTGAGMIVPEASASYDGFNVARDAIKANHMDMARFVKRDDGYNRVLGHIQDILDTKLPKPEQVDIKVVEARYDPILNILKFPMINSRVEDIDEAHAETCSWVWGIEPTWNGEPVDDTTTEEMPAKPCELLSWLRNDEQFLWISGKAGCGKSTLMKHIYHDPRTEAELAHSSWADGKSLILLGYFFYDRGNDEQKSREGMLRSLLFQVLCKRRDLIPVVFPGKDFEVDADWAAGFHTWDNLSNAFILLLDHLDDYRICLFLDGLDEYRMAGRVDEYTEEELDLIYDGNNEDEAWGRSKWITDGHKEVARFLRTFKTRRNVKVCISSRELVVFEHEFRNLPRIVVHAHTARAIAKYCQDRFMEEVPDLMDLSDFVSTITANSFGVFLWVQLVVDMLIDGHARGNYKDELWKTLEKVPARLGGKDGLYMHMMRHIDSQYLPESRRIFQLIERFNEISITELDIMTLFLAALGHLEDDSTLRLRATSDDYEPKSWDEWESRWKNLQKRLKSRCGGLLEGTQNVRFMHQTAKQFVSRKYLWPEIFRNARGFATETEQDLALLSGLIRRLNCCSEAIINKDSLDTSSDAKMSTGASNSSGSSDGAIDPYHNIRIPLTVHLIFLSIEIVALHIDARVKFPDGLDSSFTMLLDELDHVGDRLTHHLRASEDFVDSGWAGLYLGLSKVSGDPNPGVRTFIDLTIAIGISSYAGEKIRTKRFSRDERNRLLLGAICDPVHWWRGGPKLQRYYRLLPTGLIESLLLAGADPNSTVSEPNSATPAREGLTAWMSLLQKHTLFKPNDYMRTWIATANLFLKYGADPGARWYRQGSHYPDKSQAEDEIVTPEIALREALGPLPQFKKDLEELLGLLRPANEKSIAEDFSACGVGDRGT